MEFKDAKKSGFDHFQMNTLQTELINIIKKGKLEPSKTSEAQAAEAIEAITNQKISALKEELIVLLSEKTRETNKAIDEKITEVEQKTKDSISATKKEWELIKPELENFKDKMLKLDFSYRKQDASCEFTTTEGKKVEKKLKCYFSVECFSTSKGFLLRIHGQFSVSTENKELFEKSTKRTLALVTTLSFLGVPKPHWSIRIIESWAKIFKDDFFIFPGKILVDKTGQFKLTVRGR